MLWNRPRKNPVPRNGKADCTTGIVPCLRTGPLQSAKKVAIWQTWFGMELELGFDWSVISFGRQPTVHTEDTTSVPKSAGAVLLDTRETQDPVPLDELENACHVLGLQRSHVSTRCAIYCLANPRPRPNHQRIHSLTCEYRYRFRFKPTGRKFLLIVITVMNSRLWAHVPFKACFLSVLVPVFSICPFVSSLDLWILTVISGLSSSASIVFKRKKG